MENSQNRLIQNILEYCVDLARCDYKSLSALIKIHSENLKQFGEVSFSVKREVWLKYEKCLNENRLQLLITANDHEEFMKKFLEIARQWNLPVESLLIKEGRCHIYLQRQYVIKQIVGQILSDSKYGYLKKSNNNIVYVHQLNDVAKGDHNVAQHLSQYRAILLCNTLQRLLKFSKWTLINDKAELLNVIGNVTQLKVCSVMQNTKEEITDGCIKIKCGLVIDPANNKKLAKLPTEEYQKLRSNDMCLMVLHKYGVRVKQDKRFQNLVERLGSAAVIVDLMQVKHTSPVQIIRSGQGGSSKGASFILYNSARIETLLRIFEQHISNGTYEALPNFSNINYEILSEEEEWQLVFVYLVGFPNLIECCLDQLEQGQCAVHLVIRFLQGLVKVFSIYYRKTKILTQRREHLMPLIHARIYFIKAVRTILNSSMALLGIKPIDFM